MNRLIEKQKLMQWKLEKYKYLCFIKQTFADWLYCFLYPFLLAFNKKLQYEGEWSKVNGV
jgi:hypothetical protein